MRTKPTWWSYSQLALYKQCPQRFKWEREERRPAAKERPGTPIFIGTLYAQLMDRLYRERWWRLPEAECLTQLRSAMMTAAHLLTVSMGILWAPGEQEAALTTVETGLEAVLPTMRHERLVGVQNLTEYEITVPLDNGDKVTGTADLVVRHPDDALYVVDGKSGSPRWAKRDQLRLYALGLLHDPQFQRLPTKAGFWFFRERRVKWMKFTAETLGEFRLGVQLTVERLRAGDRVAVPGSQCRTCPYRLVCPEGTDFLFEKVKDHGAPVDTNCGVMTL